MYLYFSSEYPAVIKINGVYFGRIDDRVKSCKFDLGDKPFIEVCPLTNLEKQTNFIFDGDFLSSHLENLSVTDLKGGYFVKFNKSYLTNGFSVIAQQKFENVVVTVFSENGYKLSIETPCDFYAQILSMQVDGAIIEQKSINGEQLLFIILQGQKPVATCFRLGEKIEQLFFRQVQSAEFNDKLLTTEQIFDMAKHTVKCVWEYKDGNISLAEKSVQSSPNFCKEQLNPKLIPYAFLEELSVGGNYAEYLGGTVKENANRLSEFLGEFIGVFPPPVFRDINEVGVIYANGQNRYKVEYFTFAVENNLIVNLTKNT